MNITLSHPVPRGTIRAIPAKAEAHRALICAALSDRETKIYCPQINDDISATANCLMSLGADIEYQNGIYKVAPVSGNVGRARLDCGESGSTLRFLLPVAAAICPELEFISHGRLPERPISPLCDQMTVHGVKLEGKNPLLCRGQLGGGEYEIPGNISSQFISGLLMALTRVGGELRVSGVTESRPYVDMTLHTLRRFGARITESVDGFIVGKTPVLVSPGVVRIGGDWSDAAFFLTCGVIGQAPVRVSGLDVESPQGDRAIIRLLCQMGGHIEKSGGVVTAYPSVLHGIEIDASDVPDLIPVLSVAAAAATGTTRVYNAGRLRLKESDRIRSICDMIRSLGGVARDNSDGFEIMGGGLRGGCVDANGDHRIAMSVAVAAIFANGDVTIAGSEAVNKSHPSFWEDFGRLCK